MMWHNGMGWENWTVMALAMVAFWSLVAFAVISFLRSDRKLQAEPRQSDALRILDERFARGEITIDEYHDRQQLIRPVR